MDLVYVYAVLYRGIYHLKYKGSYGGSNTQYAGHLGVPIPNWLIYLNLILSKFGSLHNGWGVAVNRLMNTNMSFNGNR